VIFQQYHDNIINSTALKISLKKCKSFHYLAKEQHALKPKEWYFFSIYQFLEEEKKELYLKLIGCYSSTYLDSYIYLSTSSETLVMG
jgi:hypothetical protein